MEWLFGIFIVWLVGYVMGSRGKNQPADNANPRQELRQELKIELDALANSAHDKTIAEGIRLAANHIAPAEAEPTPLATAEQAAAQQSDHEWRDLIPPQETILTPKAHAPAANKSWINRDIRSLDSISMLLYFGAFLVIAGVGLFVGLSDFDGAVKTVAVLVLALGLYSAGLYLYQRIERLQPAAITLTAIGLISLPLTGVAAYAYVTNQTMGPLMWFMTSALCFGLYVLALWRIRQSFIGYLSVFMCLSLWMSIVAVIDAPIYFFGWAMVVLAMTYLLVGKFTRLWPEVEAPLKTSASVMVPVAVVMMIVFGMGTISLLHQGITLLLASGFYAMACWLEHAERDRLTFFVLSYILLPLASLFIAYDLSKDVITTSYVLTGVAVAQLAGLYGVRGRLSDQWKQGGLGTSAVSFVAAGLMCASSLDWTALAVLLTITLVVHALAALAMRSKTHAALGLVDALVLPSLVGFLVSKPALDQQWLVAAYILLGLLLMVVSRIVAHIVQSYRHMTIAAYGSAFVIAWLIGIGGSAWVPAASSVAVAAAVLVAAYFEHIPRLTHIAAGLGVMSALQLLIWQDALTGSNGALLVGSLGFAYYLAGKSQQHIATVAAFHGPWVASGLITLYGSSVVALLISGTSWPAIIYLGVAGVLTGVEFYLRREKAGVYGGGAVVLAAVQFGMYHLGMYEWQIYWYMWAAYPLLIAYREQAAQWVYAAALLTAVGVFEAIGQHATINLINSTLALSGLGALYYLTGKIHALFGKTVLTPFVEAWSFSGLAGLYAASFTRFAGLGYGNSYETMLNAASLMIAGGLTGYEAYTRRSRFGLYLSGAVTLVGLQWLMNLQQVTEVQIYTHMWAAYFALLAWLSYRDKRDDEKSNFTVVALLIQTLPLAWQALQGDTSYGLLLLFESVGIMLFGLWVHYPLVSRWGLAVAVGSVLYQLRDLQFFLLVLLGAGIIGLSVYLLLRKSKQ